MARPSSVAHTRAIELLTEFPNTPTRTLARRLYKEFPEHYNSVDAARSALRYAAGTIGDHVRKYASVPRVKGKAGWKPACPPSAAEPWVPLQIDGPARVLILSDLHVPYHSVDAIEAAVKFGKKLRPDVLLLNGDTCDFYRVSHWQQDPRKRMFKEEIDAAKQLLAWLRREFPKTRFVFKCGNHEDRWDAFVWNKCVELWNLDGLQLHNVLDFETFGVERVDDQPVMCGELAVLHGHEIGRGLTSPVNPARGAFLRTNHTVLIGHLHRPSSHAESDMFQSETMTWSTGCLCDRRPEYARINKWAHGFAHVDVAADNQFNVHNYRLSNSFEVRTA